MAQVVLENVTKVYPGGIMAVDGVNLSIKDQEFVVLVGPSGCGKSTTLRMVAGLEDISQGTIRIGDRVVNNVPPKDRNIAMVFQNYALYPHMTVYKNMAFGLKMRSVPKDVIDQRVREAAKILAIEHLLDRRPKALSGGQRQRVAVGRAIVREPAAFLFDEPLSNLDAKLRVTTRAELKRLHHRLKTTTIYVTHDQEEAMTLGDRIVIMKDGLIQQSDTPLTSYAQPVNRFVAGFIGMPPMNFFDGALKMVDGTLVFEEGLLSTKAVSGQVNGSGTRNGTGSDEPLVAVGELSLPGNGFKIPVPEHLKEKLAGYVNKHVVLGIRPEHFSLQDNGGCEIGVQLTLIEPLGNDMDIYMTTSLHDHVVGRVEAQAGMAVNTQVTMYVNLRKIHFFEPGDAGRNLSLVNEKAHAIA